MTKDELTAMHPLLAQMAQGEEILWRNPCRREDGAVPGLGMEDILDAEARLRRFAPFLMKAFPELQKSGGIIESPLTEIPAMQAALSERGLTIPGKLLLKRDSDLPVAGSVKARGGIYEVLKHTEDLALESGLLREGESYAHLAEPEAREFFSRHTVQVGSTGNLGLSIGIMSAAAGYHAVVHMSADAAAWKKALLRSRGVEVIEYSGDYSQAVRQGRERSDADPMSYFVDDENSKALFLGYSVAALRLKGQLEKMEIPVDAAHPLQVYLPCGVGGAPGGITFGLRQVFGDAARCCFAEPVQAPCMAAGMISGLHNQICVQDLGLSGITKADGLAVGRPSGFVGKVMAPLLSGCATVKDERLFEYLRLLKSSEDIFLEPSACAGFHVPALMAKEGCLSEATHIVWATGGSMVPAEVRRAYLGE